jgi:hypothetical protein
MISVLRNFAPITITMLEWAFNNRRPSAAVVFSMALLIVGALVGARNDMEFCLEGSEPTPIRLALWQLPWHT